MSKKKVVIPAKGAPKPIENLGAVQIEAKMIQQIAALRAEGPSSQLPPL